MSIPIAPRTTPALLLTTLGLYAPLSPGQVTACEEGIEKALELIAPEGPAPVNTGFFIRYESHAYHADIYIPRRPSFQLTRLDTETSHPLTFEYYDASDLTYWRVFPRTPLDPDTEYLLEVWHDEASTEFFDAHVFRTTAASDNAPPEATPKAHLKIHTGVDPLSDDPDGGLIPRWMEGFLRPMVVAEDELFEIEVASNPDFASSIVAFDADGDISRATMSLLGGDPEDPTYVRARLRDLSGNTGPWSETEHLKAPVCAIADNGQDGALGFLLIALAALVGGRPRQGQARPD